MRFNGRALDAANQPMAGVAGVTFAIYEEQSGGAPLWQETQNLTTDVEGRFSALLGEMSPDGIPPEVLAGSGARWLGVLPHAPGAMEQTRVLLVGVPYALRAEDSEMLGGKPASAYVTRESQDTSQSWNSANSEPSAVPVSNPHAPVAAPDFVAMANTDTGLNVAGTVSATNFVVGGGAAGLTTSNNVDILVKDGSGNTTFRGVRTKTGWSDQVSTGFFQVGNQNDNVAFTSQQGTKINRLQISSNVLQVGGGYYNSIPAPLAGDVFEVIDRSNNPRLVIQGGGNVGIGTTTPDKTLTVNGAIHSTAGGFVFPDGTVMTTAATGGGSGAGQLQGSNLVLGAGGASGGAGNVQMQTENAAGSAAIDRLLIAGTPKKMSGVVPIANLFSIHIAPGDAAGGRVKFTIVASDGTNYAMETGEMLYVANPKQMTCAVVLSQFSQLPATYTNTVLAVPGPGQTGFLNAQCNSAMFGGDPGVQIFDTAPTSFTPTTHKVYYTIENQSQSAITLQP